MKDRLPLMWEQWLNWDRAALVQINQHWTHPFLDYFTAIICDQKLFMPILILGGIALLIWGKNKGRLFILLAALNLIVGDALINPTLKKLIQRPRPHEKVIGTRRIEWKEWKPHIRITSTIKENPSGRSLPSSHMVNNVSVGAIAFLFYPALRFPFFLWLFLMGYARIYTGAHYPSDILASVWLALFQSLGVSLVTFYFCPRCKAYLNHK